MAITAGNITTYNTAKGNLATAMNNIASNLIAGDTIAFYNKKDSMFYFIRVASTPTLAGNDVSFTAFGARFSLDNPSITMNHIIQATNSPSPGGNTLVGNGKINAAWPTYLTGVKMKYCEIYMKNQPFSISDMFQNSTVAQSDDIEQIVILGENPPLPAGSSDKNYFLNEAIDYTLSETNGIMRHLVYNFKDMVN